MKSSELIEKTRATASLRFKLHAESYKVRLKFTKSLDELERVALYYLGRKGIYNTLFKIVYSKGDVSPLVNHYYDLVEHPPVIDTKHKT